MLGVVSALALALPACSGSEDGGSGTSTRAESPPDGARDGSRGQRVERDARAGRGNATATGPHAGGLGGAQLTGDRPAARAGADAVASMYEELGAAVDAGIASADVPVGDTLENASTSEALGGICDFMSVEARRQTIVYARRSAGRSGVQWTCEAATGLLLRRATVAGDGVTRPRRAEVVGVNADGDRATATIQFGGRGPLTTLPLVREDGEWKLAASPAS